MNPSRRAWLAGSLQTVIAAAGPSVRSEVFLRSAASGTAVMAYAYYTRKRGGAMVSIEQRWSSSDIIDSAYYRYSRDYGLTWGAPQQRITSERVEDGVRRRHLHGGWVDPHTGRFIEFWLEAVVPTGDPIEALRHWRIHYSIDGRPARQVIHRGAAYTLEHWLPGVHVGQNCAMLGDVSTEPLGRPDGSFLVPIDITPLAADGKLANPGGGYTYHDCAILHARWRRAELEWQMSSTIEADPSRTTRGVSEPTIAALAGDRLMLVMRGSNDRKPELPSCRWVSYSKDGGWTWSAPQPWTFNDGSELFSPSACSQLLAHSNGKLYWLGNITPANPRGNRPRYPFCIAEVDRKSGLPIRERVTMIDTLRPGDDATLSLSNFYAREDRQTHEIYLHMTRLFTPAVGWRGDAMLYRISCGSI